MTKKQLQSIDEEIRPLIAELNKMGLVTAFSCQGHNVETLYRYEDGSFMETDGRAYIALDIDRIKDFQIDMGTNNEGKRLLSIYWDRGK